MAEGEGYIPPVLFRLGNSKALYKIERSLWEHYFLVDRPCSLAKTPEMSPVNASR